MAAEPLTGESRAWSGVQPADLAQVMQQMLSSDACWGLVWRLDRIAWVQGQSGQAQLLLPSGQSQAGGAVFLSSTELSGTYPNGRVFDAHCELRWQPDGLGGFAVLGLSEDSQTLDVCFAGATVERQSDWQVSSAKLRLTGSIISEREDDPLAEQTWYETRFPKPLVYPVCHGGDRQRQPRLEVQVYKDANAAARLVRFCGMETEQE
jgi:hypothetical protein